MSTLSNSSCFNNLLFYQWDKISSFFAMGCDAQVKQAGKLSLPASISIFFHPHVVASYLDFSRQWLP